MKLSKYAEDKFMFLEGWEYELAFLHAVGIVHVLWHTLDRNGVPLSHLILSSIAGYQLFEIRVVFWPSLDPSPLTVLQSQLRSRF